MAKNDYFVIVYRILIYLYACMKDGVTPDENVISYETLNINQRYWCDILESIYEEGYIKGIVISKMLNNVASVRIDQIKITQKGIGFLEENSLMHKAKEFLKTVKEIIPGM